MAAGIGAFGLALVALPGQAADIRTAVKAPVAVPPTHTWTGFYLGGNAGYSWGDARTDQTDVTTSANTRRLFRNPEVAIPGAAGEASGAAIGAPQLGTFPQVTTTTAVTGTSGKAKVDGFIGGIQGGYNWQTGRFLLGIEADFQGSAQKGDVTVCSIAGCGAGSAIGIASHSLKWFGTVRPRVGFLATERWLVYGTGGLAYGRFDSDYVSGVGTSIVAASTSKTRTGWTAGAGSEVKIDKNWSVKFEYIYMDLGRSGANLGSGASNTTITVTPTGLPGSQSVFQDTLVASTAATVNTRFTDHIVRAGFNYAFNK